MLLGLGTALAVGLGIASWKVGERPVPSATSTGEASVGGPFRMVDQDGRPADEGRLKGRWSAVFFGYTYCPDVCPATLTTLAEARRRLGAQGEALRPVLVTVDPERDTPAALKTYLSSPAFPAGTLGLTGTPEQVAAMAKAYRVYYAKRGEGADYLMDHASAIYLMDPNGRFSRLADPSRGPKALADTIRDAVAGKG